MLALAATRHVRGICNDSDKLEHISNFEAVADLAICLNSDTSADASKAKGDPTNLHDAAEMRLRRDGMSV